jgi:hypothetical protein
MCHALGVKLFRRRASRAAQTNPDLSTSGHAGDDTLLAQIDSRGDIEEPRHWVHFLFVQDERQARSAAQVIAAAGWQIQRVEVAASGGPEWVVIAETHAATTPDAVRVARLFFEGVAATHGGGKYDGWEASL